MLFAVIPVAELRHRPIQLQPGCTVAACTATQTGAHTQLLVALQNCKRAASSAVPKHEARGCAHVLHVSKHQGPPLYSYTTGGRVAVLIPLYPMSPVALQTSLAIPRSVSLLPLQATCPQLLLR